MSHWREPAPGEREAGERSWKVLRAAFEERLPAPRKRDRRPLVAVAVGAAILAAAFSPPGLAVLGSIRDAVRGEENAKPALFSLPARGRLLVESERGVWVVQRDGSKRLLGGYHEAVWSPHGLYVAGVRGNELRAFEPDGAIHWSIGRPGQIRHPRWSFDGFRIAYFAGGTLRVVNGDGTDDHVLTRTARPGVAAWQPRTHMLAFVNRAGNIQIVNVDRPDRFAVVRTRLGPRQVEWTPDGRALVAVGAHTVGIFGKRGGQFRRLDTGRARVVAASVSPDGRSIAFIETENGRSSLQLTGVGAGPTRQILRGEGIFANVIWAPDGRWLLLDWKSADQWLFIRSVAVKRIVAISSIDANFGLGAALVGWCCP
jgi:dipeptidyl aminopeptidase/acylaminoacyl peptidase